MNVRPSHVIERISLRLQAFSLLVDFASALPRGAVGGTRGNDVPTPFQGFALN